MNTGILLFECAEELDFAGPWEVFTAAAAVAKRRQEDADQASAGSYDNSEGETDRVVLIAEHSDPIRCAKGMRVLPDYTLADAPELDVLLIPGGQGTRPLLENEAVIDWVRTTGPRCKWVTSVCTGSMVLLAAGLAKGKRITTHWSIIEQLRAMGGAQVLDNVRYVRDGTVITAAGISAGIDMSLWLVGQIYGVEHARETQRYIEYDPAPPYAAEV